MKNQDASDGEFTWILGSLKQALKAQRITYRHLARELGITESGVKKIFTAEDASYQRLSQIARVVGLSLSDILQQRSDDEFKNVAFTPEQEKFFTDHPDFFNYYWKLVYERMSVAEIARAFGLSEKDSFRYLKKLDDLRLIELHAGTKVRIPKVQKIRWVGEGPWVRKLYREWSLRVIEDVARPGKREDEVFIIRYFKMRKSTYREFLASMRHLENEFVKKAIHEMNIHKEGLENVRWVVGADSKSFVPVISGRE